MAKAGADKQGGEKDQLMEEPKVKQVKFLETEDGDADKAPKKSRKRIKGVMNNLRIQMEFYFGDANLSKDRFMKQEIDKDPDGYIPLSVFLSFGKIKELSASVDAVNEDWKPQDLLIKSLKLSDILQVSEDESKVRRITPIKLLTQEETDARTVYVEGFHKFTSRDWISRMFSKCGTVTYVSLPCFKTTREIKGYAFVEFQSPEEAVKAVQMLNQVPEQLDEKSEEKALAYIKQCKNLTILKKRATEEGIDPAEVEAAVRDERKQEGIEEEGAGKEGTKPRSKRKKKKNRNPPDATAADLTTDQKTDTAMEDCKENSAKSEAPKESDDQKVKKSKKSKKKRKRKNSLNKQTSQEDVPATDGGEDSEAKSNRAEKSDAEVDLAKEKADTEVDVSEIKTGVNVSKVKTDGGVDLSKGKKEPDVRVKTKVIEDASVSQALGSRKRRRSTDDSSDDNTAAKLSKTEPSIDSKVVKLKEEIKNASDKTTDNVDDNRDPLASDKRTETSSKVDTTELQSSSKKRKSDTVEPQQETTHKPKKQKEGKVTSQPRRSTELAAETPTTEGRKRKRKNVEGGDEESSRKKKKTENGGEEGDETQQEGRKKRHRKHKAPEPSVRLRVMTKATWAKLKDDYLDHQKANMRKLKDHLREAAIKRRELTKNKHNNGQDTKGGRSAPEFVADVILQVKSDVGLCLHTIKADIPPSINVAYVDIKPGMTEGHIRCQDADSAAKLLKTGLRGVTLSQVQGEKELQYWNKLATDRQTKLSDTNRRKRRGKLKIMQRAQNPHEETTHRQHLIFTDDDDDKNDDDFNAYSNHPATSTTEDTQDNSYHYCDDENWQAMDNGQ